MKVLGFGRFDAGVVQASHKERERDKWWVRVQVDGMPLFGSSKRARAVEDVRDVTCLAELKAWVSQYILFSCWWLFVDGSRKSRFGIVGMFRGLCALFILHSHFLQVVQ